MPMTKIARRLPVSCIFCGKSLCDSEKTRTFATANLRSPREASIQSEAQMAELVDALVSNTNGKPCRFDPGPGYKKGGVCNDYRSC